MRDMATDNDWWRRIIEYNENNFKSYTFVRCVYFLFGVLLPSQRSHVLFHSVFYLYLVMSKKIANITCAQQASFSSVALTNVGITLCDTCTDEPRKIQCIYWCSKNSISISSAKFCRELLYVLFSFINSMMILKRHCAIMLVVHFQKFLISWLFGYQFIIVAFPLR